jgi:hypothetical protein
MSEITGVEAGFHRNHVPLWLLTGVLGVARRIRKSAEASERPEPARQIPTELDYLLLGIIAVEDRLARVVGASEDTITPKGESGIEAEGGMLR